VSGLMLALFLVALDQTVVGTALPQIIADLEGFERYAQVTIAYLLASTAMIPVIGKLGDVYGREWFIVGAVVVFLVGSALCGAAWGMLELIIFRGIQGLGAGMIFANIFTSVAVAPEADAGGDEDRTLARFLRSVETPPSARPNPEESAALRGVADRIESGNGNYPALVRAAAGFSGGHGGDERERAAHASKAVIRPLAARGADGTR
jgi:MFS transporter